MTFDFDLDLRSAPVYIDLRIYIYTTPVGASPSAITAAKNNNRSEENNGSCAINGGSSDNSASGDSSDSSDRRADTYCFDERAEWQEQNDAD